MPAWNRHRDRTAIFRFTSPACGIPSTGTANCAPRPRSSGWVGWTLVPFNCLLSNPTSATGPRRRYTNLVDPVIRTKYASIACWGASGSRTARRAGDRNHPRFTLKARFAGLGDTIGPFHPPRRYYPGRAAERPSRRAAVGRRYALPCPPTPHHRGTQLGFAHRAQRPQAIIWARPKHGREVVNATAADVAGGTRDHAPAACASTGADAAPYSAAIARQLGGIGDRTAATITVPCCFLSMAIESPH